jgi:hypothetical protein
MKASNVIFSTAHSAQLLLRIMAAQEWSQADLATRAGVHRATVGQHLNLTRTIRDEHLIGYLQAVPTPDVAALASAWIQDLLHSHPAVRELILDPTTRSITKETAAWNPSLTAPQAAAMEFWGKNLPSDPELSQLFELLTRRAQGGTGGAPT